MASELIHEKKRNKYSLVVAAHAVVFFWKQTLAPPHSSATKANN
jgi:hypothetical protein